MDIFRDRRSRGIPCATGKSARVSEPTTKGGKMEGGDAEPLLFKERNKAKIFLFINLVRH